MPTPGAKQKSRTDNSSTHSVGARVGGFSTGDGEGGFEGETVGEIVGVGVDKEETVGEIVGVGVDKVVGDGVGILVLAHSVQHSHS